MKRINQGLLVLLTVMAGFVFASPASAWTATVEKKATCQEGKTVWEVTFTNHEPSQATVHQTDPEVLDFTIQGDGSVVRNYEAPATLTFSVSWVGDTQEPQSHELTVLRDCHPPETTVTTAAPTTTVPPTVAGTTVEKQPELARTGFFGKTLLIVAAILIGLGILIGRALKKSRP